jgi:hypothetical protein
VDACQQLDTSASRELRRFMKKFFGALSKWRVGRLKSTKHPQTFSQNALF